ncbi:DUF4097 domain-containing protein [Pseudalkalibacillus sp. A8]|uniref:LiaG family protein n=1 Tax=Pseudalkalibacillus sp. A8 TaxID=3382641 RepID=UPI0038B5D891
MKMLFAILIIVIGVYLLFTETKFTWFGFANDKTFSEKVENTELIDIDVSGVNTEIVPEKRDDLKVELKGKGKVAVDRRRDDINVKVRRGWFHWFGFDRSKLTIYVPENYDQKMNLDNGSGNLAFVGPSNPMKLTSLEIDMNSGNLNLKNIHTGKFSHDGSSGNVDISNMKTESASFDSSSGNVKIKKYSGALTADLSSGNLNVQMDELTGDIEVEINSGSANLDLPKDADFKLKGKTSSGSIHCNFPLKNQSSDRKGIEGTYGSGEHLIDLSVSSGNIKVH